jgi:hypothetical protein
VTFFQHSQVSVLTQSCSTALSTRYSGYDALLTHTHARARARLSQCESDVYRHISSRKINVLVLWLLVPKLSVQLQLAGVLKII